MTDNGALHGSVTRLEIAIGVRAAELERPGLARMDAYLLLDNGYSLRSLDQLYGIQLVQLRTPPDLHLSVRLPSGINVRASADDMDAGRLIVQLPDGMEIRIMADGTTERHNTLTEVDHDR